MTDTTNDELGALAAHAQGLEAEAATTVEGAGAQQAPAVPVQTNAQLLAGVFQLGRDVGCIVAGVQSPRVVLDDGTLQQLGDAWGAVADKRGWDLQRLMGDYAAEVSAVMVTITVGVKVNKALQTELAMRERDQGGEAAQAMEQVHQPA